MVCRLPWQETTTAETDRQGPKDKRKRNAQPKGISRREGKWEEKKNSGAPCKRSSKKKWLRKRFIHKNPGSAFQTLLVICGERGKSTPYAENMRETIPPRNARALVSSRFRAQNRAHATCAQGPHRSTTFILDVKYNPERMRQHGA